MSEIDLWCKSVVELFPGQIFRTTAPDPYADEILVEFDMDSEFFRAQTILTGEESAERIAELVLGEAQHFENAR